ncbi:acetate kinase [Muribaculaceae bacterium Isolate-039 (Harlan)]|jgi:acetate kinase|uniref:acetate/propionate family kinase n=1 Tax=Duncaniella muris TaxID=2094150 RepID=UPI000B1865C3|nr:acetate kinase [Duncaniella muris]ROS91776.1 acetate kinase [Muribaculaceae bacterium Isolate-039 (Harlan)]ROS97211.1 acetate kinase [Muribaculaceae bacterium Isolate-083 (Janvier)]ROS98949.1 acetate kinase [Muribaculaceae bacterium Isolate-077 (Janvier)]ROT01724.1 acetate kinase [Muribaculaceae bacterium Isolate-084 (Janvier)]
MKILVLNCGSSSVKYKLIDTADNSVLAEGGVEKIGLNDGFLKYKKNDGSKAVIELGLVDHNGAVQAILNLLTDPAEGCIKSYDEIDAVGHRVVHGAEKFSESVLINDEVKDMIKQCYDIAPLHNPANMTGIDAITTLMPGKPQVAVFDTAFHQTMPAKSFLYALPYKYYEDDGVRRYGFHGTSHRYVSQRVCEFLGVDSKDQKIITCHVGNGGSITAVDGGKSVDTSMGLTPTEGLMMGTRVGDVDPGALVYLMLKHNLSATDLQKIINKESGMAGVTGISSDMREIEAAVNAGDERAILGLAMYEQRILKYIGAYAAEMGGVDIIVFTGGVGENQTSLREAVCEPLKFMGVEIDKELNSGIRGKEAVVSTAASKVKVVVIPTDEELMIARDTEAIVSKK